MANKTHKDPTDRKHLWERPKREDEAEPEVKVEPDYSDYKHQIPRHVHHKTEPGVSKIVYTPQECDEALGTDWGLLPPKA